MYAYGHTIACGIRSTLDVLTSVQSPEECCCALTNIFNTVGAGVPLHSEGSRKNRHKPSLDSQIRPADATTTEGGGNARAPQRELSPRGESRT
eukprot:6717105-Pyramimonas_sp.AAC.2